MTAAARSYGRTMATTVAVMLVKCLGSAVNGQNETMSEYENGQVPARFGNA